jgi:N-acetylneuraminic acid mutarotase
MLNKLWCHVVARRASSRQQPNHARITAATRRTFRPVLEGLEERWLPAVTLTPNPVALAGPVVAGVYSGPVDSFTETGRADVGLPDAQASDFHAVIDWGDGSPASFGIVQAQPDGSFNVLGRHVYHEGSYAPAVTITDDVANVSTRTGPGSWTSGLPDMPNARFALAAAAGPDGRIYAIGGDNNNGIVQTVDVYDPASNSWSTAAPLPTGRDFLAAAAGRDGRIYAIGGISAGKSNKVEVYDPFTNIWSTAATLPTPRFALAAAAGPDGRIYAIGGRELSAKGNEVEVYDPVSNSWSTAAPMPTPRWDLAAVAGPDGRIYAIGGQGLSAEGNEVEVYDPASNSWSTAAPMPTPRFNLAAAVGPDGRIYAIGGLDRSSADVNTVEVYDPATNRWSTAAPMPTYRSSLAAVTGQGGRIYAIGGAYGGAPFGTLAFLSTQPVHVLHGSLTAGTINLVLTQGAPFSGAVVAFQSSNTLEQAADFTAVIHWGDGTPDSSGTVRGAAGLFTVRGSHTFAQAGTYRVLVDITDPAGIHVTAGGALAWSSYPSMPTALGGSAAAAGRDDRIYALGGLNSSGADVPTVQVTDPATGLWSVAAPMPTARDSLAAVTGADGSIYALGGYFFSSQTGLLELNTAEVYTPATDSWFPAAPMPTARGELAAAAGPDGRIYAIGGRGTDITTVEVKTVEVYDPAANSWSTAAPMPTARIGLAAVAGQDGRIYAIGGYNTSGYLGTVEVYDTVRDSWSTVAPMPSPRGNLAALLGPDGRIYAIGGYNNHGAVTTVEAYDPRTNTWDTTIDGLPAARSFPAAVLGPDGSIYVLGGAGNNTGFVPTVQVLGYGSAATVLPPLHITVAMGNAQSAVVNTAYAKTLQVQVTEADTGKPVSNIPVVFTAPATGPSVAFGTSATVSVLTNTQGMATAPALKANTHSGGFTVTATALNATTAFTLTNKAGSAKALRALAGAGVRAVVSTAYTTPLQVQLADAYGNPVALAGVKVLFQAPTSGAAGTFAGTTASASATVVTGANGVATAPAFTANTQVGSFKVTATSTGLTAASFSLTNTPMGLVSWYRAEGDASDAQGTNNGTIHGGVTFAAGKVGQAFNFDGSTGYVDLGNPASLNPATITVEAWWFGAHLVGDGNNPIVDKGFTSHTSPYYQYHLGVAGDQYPLTPGAIDFAVSVGGNPYYAIDTTHPYIVGAWNHIAGTYDGHTVALYLNGQLVASTATPGGPIDTYPSNAEIGGLSNLKTPDAYLPGLIDEVKIYNRALSAAEVQADYAGDTGLLAARRSVVGLTLRLPRRGLGATAATK